MSSAVTGEVVRGRGVCSGLVVLFLVLANSNALRLHVTLTGATWVLLLSLLISRALKSSNQVPDRFIALFVGVARAHTARVVYQEDDIDAYSPGRGHTVESQLYRDGICAADECGWRRGPWNHRAGRNGFW